MDIYGIEYAISLAGRRSDDRRFIRKVIRYEIYAFGIKNCALSIVITDDTAESVRIVDRLIGSVLYNAVFDSSLVDAGNRTRVVPEVKIIRLDYELKIFDNCARSKVSEESSVTAATCLYRDVLADSDCVTLRVKSSLEHRRERTYRLEYSAFDSRFEKRCRVYIDISVKIELLHRVYIESLDVVRKVDKIVKRSHISLDKRHGIYSSVVAYRIFYVESAVTAFRVLAICGMRDNAAVLILPRSDSRRKHVGIHKERKSLVSAFIVDVFYE